MEKPAREPTDPSETIEDLTERLDTYFEYQYNISLDNPEFTVYIIGSIASGDYDDTSDVDILITSYPESISPKTGDTFDSLIRFESVDREVHINVNTEQGVTEGKPAVKIS